ncbi:MAG TPA: c-type cytochrome [Candidatus Sulfotelmatobacter sp.]|nr:c-type cytochrome [Candidatus Sulfotelmatobacter sp.]
MCRTRQSILVVLLWGLSTSVSLAQANGSLPKEKLSSPDGRSSFNSSCAGCHGLDGSGSDKAVDISGNARVRHLSDAELSRIILHGVPGTGMPAFHNLSERQVRALVDYVRSLQGKRETRTLPGDPQRGKEIFFGKGDCSSCHAISGQGGFLGPDLSSYASTASAQAIHDEIVKPQRTPQTGYTPAVLTTTQGERLEGLIRNEDNFSIQLQTNDGSFHFFSKSELSTVDRRETSLMPANYRESLGPGELNDLVSYLMTASPEASKPAPRKKEEDDYE